jgi:hypothetical protein
VRLACREDHAWGFDRMDDMNYSRRAAHAALATGSVLLGPGQFVVQGRGRDLLVRVEAPHFVAGLKSAGELRIYFKRNGWKATICG